MSQRTRWIAVTAALLLVAVAGSAQETEQPSISKQLEQLQRAQENMGYRLDMIAKAVDDVAWYNRVGDVAFIDKWRIAGPPDANPRNPKAIGATNPVRIYVYTFSPRDRKPNDKLPLIVLPHGGVHSDFTTYHAHIVRELVEQGYVVAAPDYRGSTGYGRAHEELIDYGGREVDDLHATVKWALESFDYLDSARVGLAGWSHGGLMVLLEAFANPKEYACVFAGVPVSDLVMRIGYKGAPYEREMAAPYHIGKTVGEDLQEYKRRSPVWHVDKLAVPLLIHTNTIDEDVNVIEVEHLIQALKAAGKKFEYKIYENAPGGHGFDRIDTALARGARAEIYAFLARYLRPPRPAK
jgi:dipeptidyl aminopeptidase/acylaminoacyl peptidase